MASSNLHRNPSSSSSSIAVQHLSVSRCLLLISILLCLLMLAHNGHAEPNKQDNKAGEKKTAADDAAPAAVATEEEEVQTCTVRVQVVKKVTGKCVRLHGGNLACQTDDYLDPVNDDCLFA